MPNDCSCAGWCRDYGLATGEEHHRDCKHWSRELGTAYQTKRELIVVGTPADSDESHNCDAMGCSSLSHVVYRAPLTAKPSDEDRPAPEAPPLPLMRSGFCTAYSDGQEQHYEVRFSFRTLAEMQAVYREWFDFNKTRVPQPVNESAE